MHPVDSAERRVGRYRLLSDPDFRHSGQLFQSWCQRGWVCGL